MSEDTVDGYPSGYPKMNPLIKEKWIAALRSGEYQQAHGFLKNEDGHYCCLGVLMEIQGANVEKCYPLREDRETSVIPVECRAGLNEGVADQLAHMNDGTGNHSDKALGFKDIADWIEANL